MYQATQADRVNEEVVRDAINTFIFNHILWSLFTASVSIVTNTSEDDELATGYEEGNRKFGSSVHPDEE